MEESVVEFAFECVFFVMLDMDQSMFFLDESLQLAEGVQLVAVLSYIPGGCVPLISVFHFIIPKNGSHKGTSSKVEVDSQSMMDCIVLLFIDGGNETTDTYRATTRPHPVAIRTNNTTKTARTLALQSQHSIIRELLTGQTTIGRRREAVASHINLTLKEKALKRINSCNDYFQYERDLHLM